MRTYKFSVGDVVKLKTKGFSPYMTIAERYRVELYILYTCMYFDAQNILRTETNINEKLLVSHDEELNQG
jgi:uncharacterized protein YodC (DUF2158 family)